MPKLADIAKAANDYLNSGKFRPDVLPGCANFVSHCMANAGGPLMIVSYVPYLVDKCEKVPPTKVETGMLVVFERTYDAVSPDGIGPEDDMTHIGVYMGDGYFIDYGGSPSKVRKQKLEGWWLDRVQFYLKPPGFETGSTISPAVKDEAHSVKLFYHPAAPQIKIIINGNEKEVEWVDELILTVRTDKNRELMLMSHKFEKNPFININNEKGQMKAMECHFKWEG